MQPRLGRFCAVFSAAMFVIGMLATGPAVVASNRIADGRDPDQPPVGLDIPPRTYLQLREHQVALYRGFPFTLDYNARQVAIDMMLRQRQREGRNGSVSPASGPTWTPIGPAPIPNGQVAGVATNIPVSGRVTAIAVDPANANRVYVGTAQGGLYRTTNAAAATPVWTAMMDNAKSLAIGALAIDPAHPTTVWVGTGEGNFSLDSYAGVGLYRIINADAGSPTLQGPFEARIAGTGTSLGTGHAFQAESITSIAFDPNNDARMFVGSTLGFSGASGDLSPSAAPVGLYFSANAQAATPKFSLVSGLPGAGQGAVTDVLFAPGSSSVLLAGVEDLGSTHSGLYRSGNANVAATGGAGASPSFTRVGNTSVTGALNIKLAANRVSTTTTVLAALDSSTGGTLLKSTDQGATFAPRSAAAGFCGGQCYYDIAVAIDPSTAQKIYLGGSADTGGAATQFERSTDGGTSFLFTDANLHTDTHALSIAPSNHAVIYTGNDGGIFRSDDSGATWTSLNTATFSATQFESVAVHPTNANFTVGGTQDNGTELRNGAGNWTRADFGDGGFSAIDQNATNTSAVTIYHTYFNRKANVLGYTRVTSTANASDGNWTFIGCSSNVPGNGIGCNNDTLFFAPLALGPGSPNTVYFGTDRLYRSADSGTHNTVVGSNAAIEAGVPISAIGIAATNDNVRIVGLTNGHVYRTTTAAPSSLVDVTGGWQSQYVARAVIDPTNKAIAYVTLDGFTGGTSAARSHVWKTVNLGAASPTWTSAGSGLPDVPVNALVIDPNDSGNLFAGTDIGVYASTDGGGSWTPFGSGLPIVAIFGLAIASPGTGSEVLRAATHGKGMWDAPISVTSDNTPPTAAMTHPTLVYTAAKTIGIAWSGDDGAGSGVATFDVRVRLAKYNTTTFSSFTSIAGLQGTATSSATFSAKPGNTYCFSVRATDNALNTGSYSAERCTMVPIDDKALTHSSGWTQKTSQSGDYLGTLSISTTKGKTLTITNFRARQIGLLAIGCPNCGKVTIAFGGQTFVANLNQPLGHYVFETTVFASIKSGTLTIKVTSTTAAAHKVQIDGLVVLIKGAFPPSPPPATHLIATRLL